MSTGRCVASRVFSRLRGTEKSFVPISVLSVHIFCDKNVSVYIGVPASRPCLLILSRNESLGLFLPAQDGSKEEGKYKNNVLITSNKKKHVFLIRSAKFRERIDAAVAAAQRGAKIAMQKEDIGISR